MDETLGIIDMGSNSIRLVIYRIDNHGRYKEIHNFKIVARLREYMDDNGVINSQGMNIVIDTLKKFQEITRRYKLTNIRGIATAAVRQAVNQTKILEKIAAETDYSFKVLSEKQEAYYGYLAVINSTNISSGITVDIGGGSTEITYFKDRKLMNFHSFPFGSLTLKKFIANDLPTKEEMNKLTSFLESAYQSLPWLSNKSLPLIGIGGSARNLSLIHQRKNRYPLPGIHQYEFQSKDIHSINQMLCSLPAEKRQKVDGLSKDRTDIIIPSIHALDVLTSVVKAPVFIMSKNGLREGIFYEELLSPFETDKFPNVAEESFYQLQQDYEMNLLTVNQLSKLAMLLYEKLSEYLHCSITTRYKLLLQRAAKVSYIGEYIDQESRHQHTFYLLSNQTLSGLSHKERLEVALVASFKSKSYFQQFLEPYKDWFTKEEIKQYEFLGSILKFSYGLNITQQNLVHDIEMRKEKKQVNLSINCLREAPFEESKALKYKKHLEKIIKVPITLNFIVT
ncbi:Ppx/GppA family phosphatase [Bacillus taeanensis]|nr:Ppx/GppA family phosphatase [Bacillus taeanensis]